MPELLPKMSLPITEIVFGPAPPAYRASPHDLSLDKPAYHIIQRQDGLIKYVYIQSCDSDVRISSEGNREYYGLQSEDGATTYGFYSTYPFPAPLLNPALC